ncbi:uncharacterized protein LOC111702785 [Eurytemora carolleeae]|uniref:uncharacterized protein LOC111702785 n=1 Tax=Eurytemora carolleeae TaxID=1294199 RepID=UPI000C77E4C0|nr:uncharacterized protein LOC111702785 [Eurytemora carolleeae]|eukprot:XP_023330325.1 uncharacterized protein LOC111702785 [Eurytemora affinis]
MPIYKYFGAAAKYHGKPLFHILSNLKEFGKGRIISRAGFKDEKPSFYRVLFAQPLMDSKSEEGRVIVEKVRNGVKYTKPVDLSNIAPLPDFILIPRTQEEEFCKWSELREYSPEKDIVVEPKYYTMPPLLRLLMEREMSKRGEDLSEDKFLLPHFKTFQRKDCDVLEDGRVEKYQETVTRCEGTASYSYADQVSKEYSYGVLTPEGADTVLKRLPEEEPFPKPEVGMRLTKIPWSDMEKRNREEARTS